MFTPGPHGITSQSLHVLNSAQITVYSLTLSIYKFLPLEIRIAYLVEHGTFGLLYAMLRFSTRIFYRVVLGFATFGLSVFGVVDQEVASCKLVYFFNFLSLFSLCFTYILIAHNMKILHCIHLNVLSKIVLYFYTALWYSPFTYT